MCAMRGTDLLSAIREMPGLYLGEPTLTGLYYFWEGYNRALHACDAVPLTAIPREMHDWVACRLRCPESTAGWRSLLLERVPDEREAFARFFTLLDEFYNRKAHDLAIVRNPRRVV